MKGKRHIQSFNEHQENLNISDVSVRSNNIYEFEHLIYYQKEYDDFIIDGDFDKISKYSLSELDNFDIKIEYNSWSDFDKLPKFIILKCNYNEKLLEVKFKTKYDFFDGNYHMFIDKLISIKPI